MNTASAGRSAALSAAAGEPSTRWRRPSARLTEHRKVRRWPPSATTASLRASDWPKAIVSRSSRVRHERPARAM